MNTETIKRLNALNREFYRTTVQNFDESRGRFWPGWDHLLPLLAGRPTPLRVLDVGCGNGRFGRFLGKHLASPVFYHGLDNSPPLLERAAADLSHHPTLTVKLEVRDLIDAPPAEAGDGREVIGAGGLYDLVALFGVVHHVPGAHLRRDLLRRLSQYTAPGGLLVFTAWCFYEYDRFRERSVAWPAEWEREAGDHLLDWRRGHAANAILRYCHYVDEAEQTALVEAIGWPEAARFRADGHTHDINRYSILLRPAATL